MKKVHTLLDKPVVIIVLLLFITIPTLLPLFNPGYFSTQDYIYVARIQQMKVALEDLQFPPRWAPDFRYGEPLYNFYAPLPYYFAAFIKITAEFLLLQISYLNLTKFLFMFGFFASVVTMYLLGRRLYGNYAGIVTATLYLYAPYHSVDLYVRGAISEAYALIIFPVIFFSVMAYAEKRATKWFIAIVLSCSALFYTHNIMTILFSPFILLWMGYWSLKNGWKLLPLFGGAFVLAILSATSYLLPAFFEKNLVQSSGLTSGYFDFKGHFVSSMQWFYSPWGYGASLWGDEDDMSFMLGATHWATFFLTGVLLIIVLFNRYLKGFTVLLEKDVFEGKKKLWLILSSAVFSFGFLFSLFMTHVRSAFIWEEISLLAFTQFPWRFLGVSIFFVSLFGGLLIYLLKERLKFWVGLILILVTIIVNIGYFRPDIYYYDATDQGYIEDVFQSEDRIPRDYVPRTTIDVQRPDLDNPEFQLGTGLISNFHYNAKRASFSVYSASESAIIEVPVTYFPGWKVESPEDVIMLEPDKYGLIRVELLSAGSKDVVLYFGDTPIRTVGNILSGITFSGLLIFGLYSRLRKKKVT